MIMEALGERVLSRRMPKPKLRPKPQLGGGPIADRGSRRNLRRIEAMNLAPPSHKAKMRHTWYRRLVGLE